ncbi:MAG: SpoIIE family protein phosphatase [Saprospiraceae bacterium]|nr:SpoIIE family protein phosphatase [Saprospiraceae bacterium]
MQDSRSIEEELLNKAADVTDEGITISSMIDPGQPLIYVNHAFEHLTGYKKEEVLGRNCRFLQGPGTDKDAVAKIRQAIQDNKSLTLELLNYKKDGSPFWNRLSISPIRNSGGKVTHYVGVQSDISELRNTQEDLEQANQELNQFREKILSELNRAKIVQQFLLPAEYPVTPDLEFASLFVPMEQIGGDFYDILTIEEGVYGLLIADVVGHGIPAALLTFMSSTTFKNSVQGITSTATTIAETNRKLQGKMPDDAFVTMFYAIYESKSRRLTYTQAGHPEAYLLRKKTGEIISLKTGDTILGIFSHNEVSYTEKSIELNPGDKLILYTDAIMDAMAQDDSRPNMGLKDFLKLQKHLPIHKLFDLVYNEGLRLSENSSYPDDFTIIGFEVLQDQD